MQPLHTLFVHLLSALSFHKNIFLTADAIISPYNTMKEKILSKKIREVMHIVYGITQENIGNGATDKINIFLYCSLFTMFFTTYFTSAH